jgi:thiol:disulfide interchange protein
MDKKVLSAPEIKEKLKDFTVIKFQAEDLKNAGIAGILKHYNIQGLPSFVILERK